VRAAIWANVTITERQRQVLINIYELFREEDRAGIARAQPTQPAESPLGETVFSLNGQAIPNRREG
jgi:hypothetical protein